ncbi:GntR family transcriptional regulator [Actimicrobium sp. CCC2.4]|uniref:GntR family transcriptional regulator n=1 Tax=Actimicrobium sp. CCC2.4 TaxID=3048606 RepID=UPI002B2477DE|nr:GntR family transcriptional regulator [Actimicrobium sp. CCC2.4]MEB0135287.1 GntR family transcriptional regulator [Actimicrobium sp. CCC2.4]
MQKPLKPESLLIKDIDTASQVRKAIETLEEDIAFGYMHPRERLVEDELLERFGLKRHVVRQVLAELEQMGLVERKKNAGALVKSYTVKEVIDLYIVRDILETNCARQITLPVPPEKLAALEDIQRQHDAAVIDGNLHVAFRMNLAFHKTLFALSDNSILTELIALAAQRTHVIRSLTIVIPQILEQARQDHHQMIDALRTGNQDRLVELCRGHLLPSRDAYIEQHRRLAYSDERAGLKPQPG